MEHHKKNLQPKTRTTKIRYKANSRAANWKIIQTKNKRQKQLKKISRQGHKVFEQTTDNKLRNSPNFC